MSHSSRAESQLFHFGSIMTSLAMTLFLSMPANAKIKEGGDFPTLKVMDFPGAPKIDPAKLKGKVVIVDFWASWCEPCKVELPALNALYKKYKGQGLEVVGVNVDDDIKDAKTFLKDHGVSFPLGYDKGKKTVESLEVTTMPTSFVLSNGKVIKIHSGFREGDQTKIENEIKSLLKK